MSVNCTNNIEKNNLSLTSSEVQSKGESNFNNYLQETIQTVEDVRIKHGVEQDVIDDFLNTKTAGGMEYTTPKNIDKIYNPLSKAANSETSITLYDDILKQEVTIELSPQNIQKLKDKFGSIEDSKEFVKKWYDDAAYGVGYLENDTDKNGVISKEEALKLKSLVDLEGKEGYMSIDEAIKGDEKQMEFLNKFGYINNINDFINNSISQDKDFDGLLSNAEILGESSAKVVDAILGKEQMDIFAFNELVSSKLDDIPDMDYARLAQNNKDSLVDAILQDA